jgi:hypothetical protein
VADAALAGYAAGAAEAVAPPPDEIAEDAAE